MEEEEVAVSGKYLEMAMRAGVMPWACAFGVAAKR